MPPVEWQEARIHGVIRLPDSKLSRGFPMNSISIEDLSQVYYEQLLSGDRLASRQLIEDALENQLSALALLSELVWPTMELLQSLYREDRINITQLNLAT